MAKIPQSWWLEQWSTWISTNNHGYTYSHCGYNIGVAEKTVEFTSSKVHASEISSIRSIRVYHSYYIPDMQVEIGLLPVIIHDWDLPIYKPSIFRGSSNVWKPPWIHVSWCFYPPKAFFFVSNYRTHQIHGPAEASRKEFRRSPRFCLGGENHGFCYEDLVKSTWSFFCWTYFNFSLSQMLYGAAWYIYLQNWVMFRVNVGK